MTSTNPFRPPLAPDPAPDARASAAPVAVVLMMAVLGILVLASVFAIGTFAFLVARGSPFQPPPGFVAGLLVHVGLLTLCAAALAGLYRARRWSRLLALVFVGLLVVTGEELPVEFLLPGSALRPGAHLARFAIPAMGLWWAWALGFSARGRRYFGLPPITSLRQGFTNKRR